MTKKITISLLTLVLVLSMFIGLVACDNKDEMLLPFELKYGQDDSVARMPGDKTATELQKNPNRGFSFDLYMTLDEMNNNYAKTYAFPITCTHEGHTKDGTPLTTSEFMKNQLEKYKDYNVKVVNFTIFLTNYMDKDLTDTALEQITSGLRAIRDKDMSVVLKFAYQHGETTVKPPVDIVLKHMETLGKRFKGSASSMTKYTVNAFRLSFVGEDGNFVENAYSQEDTRKIINGFVAMLPDRDGVYSEAPNVAIKNSATDYKKLLHMGFYNDNFANEVNGYTSGGIKPNTKDYNQYIYQSNVNFNSASVMPNAKDIDGKAVLRQMRDGFFSTFDLSRMYAGTETEKALVDIWKETPVTKKDLKNYGLPYYDEWFLNSDGTSANRSVFDYLRDFLGYNISITNLKFEKDIRQINGVMKPCTTISFTITNYGMAAPLFIDKFELCIKNNATGQFINKGNALTYTNYDPKVLVSGGQINISQLVVGNIDIAEGAGLTAEQQAKGHSIGIRMYQRRSPRDQYVRLSNDVPFDGKVNWIYSTETKK